ncbi:DEAD/DEAH box helicase [Candidatus Woesearchaeota archaeon]|nr:DEAD/DEAH box helicase [Candidatus Woesearchaeota archaeon]
MIKIKNFTPRQYQENILNSCIKKNCLIVLPTGLGKTKTSILVSAYRLNNFPNSKVLFLTPTKPLANQIYKEYTDSLDMVSNNVVLFTGEISPEKRKLMWDNAQIIISTPQGCLNDIINASIDIKNVSLLILDEVHRCVGNYDYIHICKHYQKNAAYPRIIGLTASPGSDINKISEVCKNAFIEDIEIRTEYDKDVSPYIKDIDIEWIKLDLTDELKEIKVYLEDTIKERLIKLKNFGVLNNLNPNTINKKDLLVIQAQAHAKISRGEKNFVIWHVISLIAETIKIHHSIELLETQGIYSLHSYMKNLFQEGEKKKVKAVKNLIKDPNFKSACFKAEELYKNNINHPKLNKLKEIIKEKFDNNKNIKIIIFNQYRSSASNIEKELNKIENVKAKLFVGQLKKGETGLSQREQREIIDKFIDGTYNVLVSTSIGEEGLDIPKVDVVIFYEPVPSAIRSIQRRGRTARHHKGQLIVLMTKNSRDEAYHWVAHNKEKRMYRLLKNIKEKLKLSSEQNNQQKISAFVKGNSEIKIIADYREKGSGVIKDLINLGVNVVTENLVSGDYLLSDRVGVEFKTKEDFINSIIDNRLLPQIRDLRNNFTNPLLIISGEEDIYSIRNMHPNAIRGMLAAIALNYNVPILFTKNTQDTAALLKVIATREQKEDNRSIIIRGEKKPLTDSELQEFIIQSLPGIGPVLAKSLLKKFKTVRNLINLSQDELKKIENIGGKKASEIDRILNKEYNDDETTT